MMDDIIKALLKIRVKINILKNKKQYIDKQIVALEKERKEINRKISIYKDIAIQLKGDSHESK